ncbi:MAG: hypothetical protein RLY17_146, partial [Pseudomonadota bacterium]
MKTSLTLDQRHLSAPDYTRRRLITALALSPLLFALPARAANTPQIDINRVVALEWL